MGRDPVHTQFLKPVTVKSTANTFILEICCWDTSPAQAALGANSFAKAYLEYKRQQGADQIQQQQSSIENQMTELNSEQDRQNRILEQSVPGKHRLPQRAGLARPAEHQARGPRLLARPAPPAVNPGQVILPAVPPKSPSSPKVPMNAAVGLFLGLFCGVVRFLLDRMDNRSPSEAPTSSPIWTRQYWRSSRA